MTRTLIVRCTLLTLICVGTIFRWRSLLEHMIFLANRWPLAQSNRSFGW